MEHVYSCSSAPRFLSTFLFFLIFKFGSAPGNECIVQTSSSAERLSGSYVLDAGNLQSVITQRKLAWLEFM